MQGVTFQPKTLNHPTAQSHLQILSHPDTYPYSRPNLIVALIHVNYRGVR
jgi:hypothetical protein